MIINAVLNNDKIIYIFWNRKDDVWLFDGLRLDIGLLSYLFKSICFCVLWCVKY